MVRSRVAVLVLMSAAALTACGNPTPPAAGGTNSATAQAPSSSATASSDPVTTSVKPPNTSSQPEQPPGVQDTARTLRCSPAVLRGELQPSDSAAGQRYATLVVTNTGGAPCTLYGYGGLQLVGANGGALPTALKREPKPGPKLVTLQPGKAAAKNLHWGAVPSGNEPVDRPCQAEPVRADVIPPDETESFQVKWTFGPVCRQGEIEGSAYYAK